MDELSPYVNRTSWRNIGGWVGWRSRPSIGLRTPWGNLIVKSWSDRLFSERYGMRKSHFRLFGLCISWVRLKAFRTPPTPTTGEP